MPFISINMALIILSALLWREEISVSLASHSLGCSEIFFSFLFKFVCLRVENNGETDFCAAEAFPGGKTR